MGSGIGKRANDKAVSALDRIKDLEDLIEKIVEGTQKSLTMVEERFNNLEEMLTACVNILGGETVRDHIIAGRKARAETAIDAAKVALTDALAKQTLIVLDKLPPAPEMTAEDADQKLLNILVVGRELEADGSETFPGRVQQPLGRILPALRGNLADGTVGTVIDLPEGRSFQVDELYIENPSPPPAVDAPAAP